MIELRFEGNNFLRQRLVLATLSGKPIVITNIRSKSESPGIKEYEMDLIRLLGLITNGSDFKISDTGTRLMYKPGILTGGNVDYTCNLERAIGYYLEMLLCLAPFCKQPVKAVLKGITDCNKGLDPGVDFLKSTSLPLLIKFGVRDEISLKVVKRAVGPLGGGEVTFFCPIVKKLRHIQFLEQGKVKKIRGVAFSIGVSPQMANRLVHSARRVLNQFIPDIYIYTDHRKGNQAGKSPGFGISLVAESTEAGVFYAAEACSHPKGSDKYEDPEKIGDCAAKMLLEEISKGGCVGSINQSLAVLLMILGEQNVVKLKTGPLTEHTIHFLQHIRDFFNGKTFKLKSINPDHGQQGNRLGTGKVELACTGLGFTNIAKTIM